MSTGYDVSLVLRHLARTKVTKWSDKQKLCNLLLMHICYHLREPGMRCVVCAYSNSLTYMVFSRVGRVQLLLPATLVSLVTLPSQ